MTYMFSAILYYFVWMVVVIAILKNIINRWVKINDNLKYRKDTLPADGSDPFENLHRSLVGWIDAAQTTIKDSSSQTSRKGSMLSKRLLQDDANKNPSIINYGYDSQKLGSTGAVSQDPSGAGNNWNYAKENVNSDHDFLTNELHKPLFDPMDPMINRREQSIFLNPLVIATLICAGAMLFLFWVMQVM